MPRGKVYLVGAGPGDPGLVTLRAAQLLREADVVIYDRLVTPSILALARTPHLVDAGKWGDTHKSDQQKINRLLVREAHKHRVVVRLKGGDPFIFGRGGEEAEHLKRHKIGFEIVPGVTAAIGAATYAGIPLTHRRISSRVTFLTGHAADEGPANRGTLVFYMGVGTLPDVARRLVSDGWPRSTPVSIVQWATTPRQRTVTGTLADIAKRARGLRPPAVTIVGNVVALRDNLRWIEKRPLFGMRILVTRSRERAADLARRLESLGAEAIEFPTIEIHPVAEPSFADLDASEVVLFTSATTVGLFFEKIDDVRRLARKVIAAVGPATAAALREHGIRADIVAEEFTSEALAKRLKGRVFHPAADKSNPDLPRLLRRYTKSTFYRIAKPKRRGTPEADLVTFASAQTIRNYVELGGDRSIPAACIGPVTARAARALGFKVAVQPSRYTIPDLVESIVAFRARK